jgi:hypothetical protein
MNPRKAKASTRDEKENENDAKSGSVDKKKQKIPAGLALMHGFSSTSVGKSRLTVRKIYSGVGCRLIHLSRILDGATAKFRCI